SVEFTLPESNTTWNFLSLAVTPQLQNGMYTASVVSSKPLMVQPNMPRFARQGDVMVLPIALYNTTDEAMQGQVKMTLYNPTNEHEIMALSEPLALQAQASTMVQFSVTVPDTLSLVGVRVGATTSLYSDGEQHLLPLLPSTTVVTESKPFYVAPTVCDTTITFDAMREKLDDSGVQNLRLTLEYCDNPTWYAVTALPSLAQTSDRGAISVMASLYAHVVAAGIVAQNPAVAHALSWWRDHADDEALVSPLMQNEELKQLILSETPWLLEATTSTEQLQQIALLLDTNRAQYLGGEAVARLSDMQQSDGGWPWIKGMQSSFTITLNVVAGLSRLMQWGDMGNTEPMAMMRIEALRYLDAEYLRRNKEREAMPDYQDLCYLYVRSAMLDVPMGADVLAIYRQQLGAIASQWYKCDEIEKAYAAVALYRNGYVQEAHDIINSLREYAVMSANQGMYWPNNRTYSSYRNSAIQVHCAIYEAFELVSPISSELDAMRQWLLLQKQTQAWENVPSTLDAVHILLTSNVEWLQKGDATHISWGETALPEAPAVEQIMGYVKCVREGDEVNVKDAAITISNHVEKPSWGEIYWHYIDKSADVEVFAQDEIAVDRGYYIERDGV
ncbi:MAG: hypothetical protein J6U43_01355, partial [Bacteroidales bacterium]|nr:hypothetical protein [Bacteroidales bacterium]